MTKSKQEWEKQLDVDFACNRYGGLPDGYSDWENFDTALKFRVKELLAQAKLEERQRVVDILMKECDRTENEGGRLLLEWYKSDLQSKLNLASDKETI
jgi:hypothetical protein